MYISKMSLHRRTFLRGMGAAIALPLLDAMVPALTPLARAAAAPRTRFGAIYIPNGAIVDEFFPKATGTNWEFTPILKPIEPFKDQLVVVKNLTRSHPGSQVGDHAVSVGGYLTGVWPKRTEAEDVLANTTIDQVVAKQIGQDTPLPSLEVATEDFTGYVGACSPGFSCAYLNTISWNSPTTPLPMEINPRTVFERLFGQAGTAASRADARAAAEEHPRLDLRRSRRLAPLAGLARPDARERVSGQHPRNRAAYPAGRSARLLARDRRRADRRARFLGRTRRPAVRPRGRRVPGGRHPRLHVHACTRAEPADVRQPRRHRAASHGVAPRQRPGQDREERQDQHVSHAAVREVPRRSCVRRRTATARCSIIR